MKNLLAGLMGSIIGATAIVVLLGLTGHAYPPPFDSFWFLLEGSSALQSTIEGLLTISSVPMYITTWILIGIILAPFSKKGWNTVRSALWMGTIQGVFALTAFVLINPNYWNSPERNLSLIYHFGSSLIIALLSLISAYPLSIVIERTKKQKEPPIPQRIETRCACGAVFKSNPLICSECGAILRDLED